MGHACGATPWIRWCTMRIVGRMNKMMDDDDEMEVDPVSMKGIKYFLGVKFSPFGNCRIKDSITLEQIWGCTILGDLDGQLKDTCLSFALFWLILGRLWGYPLYQGRRSKTNAWKLVYNGLVAQGSAHERVFRIIEVELSFLQDYFYSNYMFYYQLGLPFKAATLFPLPIVFWLCTIKGLGYKDSNIVDPIRHGAYTKVLLLVMFSMEVIQFLMFIFSRWVNVSLVRHFAEIRISNKAPSLCALKAAGALCRTSFLSNKLFKPWKRKLDQYSLLESCTSWGVRRQREGACLTTFGFPVVEKGKRLSSSVVLCEHVKRAVVQSLCINSSGPKLSDGVASLRRNGVDDVFSWACRPKKYAETILLWHVATDLCEMNPNSWQECRSQENFKVAKRLSRYCAYLLFFSPLLLPVPPVQAEFMCENAIIETKELFRKSRNVEEMSKYEKLKEHYRLGFDEEGNATLVQKGVKLGEELVSVVEDEGRRWKILAEFWAEMILFLAPSNCNEMVHADKLADGGEFITHLWALLIHAGIVDREDLVNFVE